MSQFDGLTERQVAALKRVEAQKSTGRKNDQEKTRLDLLPPRAELAVGEVLTVGAKKYAPENWRKVEDAQRRYMAAAMRHLNAVRRGERLDPETGLPHLAHAICSLSFILELALEAEGK